MGGYSLHQGPDGVHANGPVDVQFGGTTVRIYLPSDCAAVNRFVRVTDWGAPAITK